MILGACLAVFFRHPAYKMTSCYIQGQNFVSHSALDAVAKNYYGRNIVWVAFGSRLHKDVVRAFPQLESVRLLVAFPDQVQMRVVEKKPWVSFLVEGRTIWVARDGTILSDPACSPMVSNTEQVVIIRGVLPQNFSGRRVHTDFLAHVAEVVDTIHRYLPSHNLQLDFKQVQMPTGQIVSEGVELIKDDTLLIKLGSFDALDDKFRCLQGYLSWLTPEQQEVLKYIDVRVPPKVVIYDGSK